jgi:hypothetical protein
MTGTIIRADLGELCNLGLNQRPINRKSTAAILNDYGRRTGSQAMKM